MNDAMKPDVCIYHGNCADGFTAAWAIWKRWPDITFLPGIYGQEPYFNECRNKHVLLVDFSYKKSVLEELAEVARTVTVVDHHKSALADLDTYLCFKDGGLLEQILFPLDDLETLAHAEARRPIQAYFDMTKSGAMLAWEYAHPDKPSPDLVKYVQDRDLWQFKLAGSKEIAATIFSYEYTFENWETINSLLDNDFLAFVDRGASITQKHDKDIKELLAMCQHRTMIAGYDVPVANLPYTMCSDAGNIMAQGEPFAATYYDTPTTRNYSLRSTDDGVDVSIIAAKFGGGGHKNAAGFAVPRV